MADPLLLLPGFMGDARTFQPQIARFSGLRAVHCAPLIGETVADMASHVIAHAPPRFALAGHGLGGMVAMAILAEAPDMVARLALISTTMRAESPETASEREPQIARAKAGRIEDVMREEIRPRHLAPGPRRAEVLGTVVAMAQSLGADRFAAQSRALMRRPDRERTLKSADCPVLVLCGSHDTIYPVQRQEVMAGIIPGATFEIVEDAGHIPTLERPNATNEALDRWLSDRLLLS